MTTILDSILQALSRRTAADGLTGSRESQLAAIEDAEREVERLEDLIPETGGFVGGYRIDAESTPDLLIINAPFHRVTPDGHLDGRYDIEARVSRCETGGVAIAVSGGLEDERQALAGLLSSFLELPDQAALPGG
ncbi:hypothetical protein FE249_18040 (plasmid) [Acidiphilium multivorum]|uniref:hypothetical protein n=1 Tax=Acidiphilium TaxID=522 RepID=UPI00157AA134|nr:MULTISPECIES: hypothetical protein [Acidiphilium]UNC16158.1 hypothetical protein FE249_18040 [Acidiphilium multivorum]